MTEHAGHGEPGHICETIDATDSLAGIIFRRDGEFIAVDSWADGISREALAGILRQMADAWEAEAAADRATIAGLN